MENNRISTKNYIRPLILTIIFGILTFWAIRIGNAAGSGALAIMPIIFILIIIDTICIASLVNSLVYNPSKIARPVGYGILGLIFVVMIIFIIMYYVGI